MKLSAGLSVLCYYDELLLWKNFRVYTSSVVPSPILSHYQAPQTEQISTKAQVPLDEILRCPERNLRIRLVALHGICPALPPRCQAWGAHALLESVYQTVVEDTSGRSNSLPRPHRTVPWLGR